LKYKHLSEVLLVTLATALFASGLCFVPPTVFASADYALFYKVNFHYLADAVSQGRLPLWNPYIGLGRPFLADMQNAVLYPPAYLVCLGEKTGMFLLVWLHCLLAVWGMRRLGGALQMGRWQAYFVAFSFLGSGALTARWVTGEIAYCWAICYLPALFYFALRTEERWQPRRIACYALLLALQFLCGHPQVFWLSLIGQIAFLLARAPRLPLGQAAREAGRGFCQFAAACLGCGGLSAAVLLPMLELAGQGNRSANSPDFVNWGSLSWKELQYLFGPLYAGVSWENNIFVGSIIVLIGCAGFCLVRERNVRGLLGVLAIGLLIALGNRTPFFGIFYHGLPGFAAFRLHARAALLVVLALNCAAGIWLSRPHPRLQAYWTELLGGSVRYALIGLVAFQALDLALGTWEIKRILHSAARFTLAPLEEGFVQRLAAQLQQAGLMEPLQPPPRVCMAPSLTPANYGMLYGYSGVDANCSLFLRRPWDYLHAVLGIPPEQSKGFLAPQIYRRGVFPYPDLGLVMGFDPGRGKLVLNTNPAPRAFLVGAAEVADYATILHRLAQGYNIHRGALLEQPLPELLPQESTPPGTATIRRFEPESLLIAVEARQTALLVLAEAWYPGWRAEVDGVATACVPANVWMRAVPVPPGRHQVRLCFHQDYLVAGLLVSLASFGLFLTVVAMSARHPAQPVASLDASAPASAVAPQTRWLRTLAVGALALTLVTGLARERLRVFRVEQATVDAETQFHLAMIFHQQQQTAQAIAHYVEALRLKPDHVVALNNLAWILAHAPAEYRNGPEAVRLAQRACELTAFKEPMLVQTLATAFAEAGRLDDAVAAAASARDLALAAGQREAAAGLQRLIDRYKALTPAGKTNQPAGPGTGSPEPRIMR
jgi:Bacterial membrane protein YfhO